MNYSMISYILGWIFNFEAAFMILPGITAIIYREKNGLAFLITMLICLTIGIPLTRRKRKSKVFHAKEGAVTVALSWLVLSIAGALRCGYWRLHFYAFGNDRTRQYWL